MKNQILNKSLLKVLNEKQVNKYDETGFLFIESFVKKEWLSDLKDITYKMIHESRMVKETNDKFVQPKHSPTNFFWR